MKHKVRLEVVTEKPGSFGTRNEVEHRTVTVNSRVCRKLKQEQFRKGKESRELTEEQRLAALYLMWEEEMTDTFGR